MTLERFTLTKQHVDLLRNGNISIDSGPYWGTIGLDCKRPFGNSDIIGDMARIVGIEPLEDDNENIWPKGTEASMWKLFLELPLALQVILAAGTFEPGEYVSEQYMGKWRKA